MIQCNQFVPQDVCRACKGCCRYAAKNTSWSPLFLFEEIVHLTENNIVPACFFTHAGVQRKHAARIDLVDDGEEIICPCFDRPANRCKIYLHRPMDCRIYPFVLARRGKEAYLGVDEKCPYVQQSFGTGSAREYEIYLENVLESAEFLKLAQNNPEIIQDYENDIRYLRVLPACRQAGRL